jgi:hypothetical protein
MRVPELVKTAVCKKIAFTVAGNDSPILKKRLKSLSTLGFKTHDFQTNFLCNEIEESIKNCVAGLPIKVLLDVTSLPRVKIALVISEFMSYCPKNSIDLTIAYTLAKYVPPSSDELEPNNRVSPVTSQFAGWVSSAGLDVTTIVGLGYEQGKALGAVEYLQASDWFLFSPQSPEKKYRKMVENHNKQLIKAARTNNLMDYEVLKPVQTLLTLGSVIAGIKTNSKPVLLPFGPKIFFALSLLAAIIHEEAAVWYVSGEENEEPVDRPASTHTTGIRFLLTESVGSNDLGSDNT